MNKSALIAAVSNSTSLAKREVEDAVNALVHAVMSEVRSGRRVSIAGFGTFNPTRRAARVGRNPRTGEEVRIAPARGVRFAAGSTFKGVVNDQVTLDRPGNAATSPGTSTAINPVKSVASRPVRKSTRKSPAKSRRAPAKRTATQVAETARASIGPAAKVVKRAPARQGVGKASARKEASTTAKKAVRRASARKVARRAPAR